MISPNDIRSHILGDPLISWLETYHSDLKTPCSYKQYLLESGNQFEKYIIDQLSQTHSVYTINETQTTLDAIQKKVPIIYGGYLVHKNLHGFPDLLIHSDYLPKFGINLPDIQGYIVVDIKLSTMHLKSNGTTLLNSGDIPYYKAQVWFYTHLLNKIQKTNNKYALIIGKKWKYTSKKITHKGDWTTKWGLVDFKEDNHLEDQVKNAIMWVEKMRSEGNTWCLSPPTVPELYPNMTVDEPEWSHLKKTLALQLGEITYLWQCGLQERKTAWKQGIFSFYDPKCTSQALGVTGTYAGIIDRILTVNRQDTDTILPKNIKGEWWINSTRECFLDFETVVMDSGTYVFMTGVGWWENEIYQYRSWLLSKLEDEKAMMGELTQFLTTFDRIWYWYADQNIYKSAMNRNHLEIKPLKWCDLSNIFHTQKIVIKNCYKYGLKDIANALYNHGLINIKLTSDCTSGLDALHTAVEVYTGNRPSDEVFPSVIEYNKFDVKVLCEILNALRKLCTIV